MIEVLVSLFLIALGIAVFLTIWESPQMTKSISYKIIASKIASKQIENLRASTGSLSVTSTPIGDSDLNLLPNGSGTLVIATSSPGSADGKLKKISAIVEWKEKNTTKSFRVDTLINR